MGHLIYGVAPAIQVDDWALYHLQQVMVTKLRRDESFSFSWGDEPAVGGDEALPQPGQHGMVWISKASSLYFSFDKPRQGPLNPQWLTELATVASSTGGLRRLPEPV